jgi:hypothetical protein
MTQYTLHTDSNIKYPTIKVKKPTLKLYGNSPRASLVSDRTGWQGGSIDHALMLCHLHHPGFSPHLQ